MFFDTHTHYNDEWFETDRDDLLTNLPNAGIDLIVNLGENEKENLKCIELA